MIVAQRILSTDQRVLRPVWQDHGTGRQRPGRDRARLRGNDAQGAPAGWIPGVTLQDLERDFAVQLIAIAVIVLVSLAVAMAVRDRPAWVFDLNPAASCLAVSSLLAILVVTVSRQGDARTRGGVQLVPLYTLRSYQHDPSDLLLYLIGNVALFMPLGFFLYLALRRRLITLTVICAVLSLGVEILQIPIYTRSSDVDDVLTNTVGGFFGALAGFALLHLIRAIRVTEHGPIRHYSEGSRKS